MSADLEHVLTDVMREAVGDVQVSDDAAGAAVAWWVLAGDDERRALRAALLALIDAADERIAAALAER